MVVHFWDGWKQNPSIIGRLFGAAFSIHQPLPGRTQRTGICRRIVLRADSFLKACGRWLKRTGREVRDLDESVARDFCGALSRAATARTLERQRCGGCWRCSDGLELRPKPKQRGQAHPSNWYAVMKSFLLEERNLRPQTVAHRRLVASRFLSEQFGGGPLNLSKLRAPDVTTFVQRHAHDHGPFYARHLMTGNAIVPALSALQGPD